MLGLADSFMNASRFRADQEARARDAAMRERQMAMQEAQHRMQMEEGGLRLGRMRRIDQAEQDYAAPDQATGLPPQAAVAADPYAGQPAGTGQFMEANGVQAPAAGLPAPKAGGKYDKARALLRAKGDIDGELKLADREKVEGYETGRRAEMQRLMKMAPEELESMWSAVNRDGSGANMMLTFDPKSRKYMLASKEPGVPSRLFSHAELVNDMMALWEAGNGDTLKGMQAMVENAKRRREMADREYGRSADIAKGDASAYFKGLEADNDANRTKGQIDHWKAMERNDAARTAAAVGKQVPPALLQELSAIEQKYVNSQNPQEKQLLERQYQMVLSRAGAAVGKPMGLPNQRGQQPQTPLEKAQTYKAYVEAGMDPMEARAMVDGYNLGDALRAAAERKLAEKTKDAAPAAAAPAPKPAPQSNGTGAAVGRLGLGGPANPQAAQIMDYLERQRMAKELAATLGQGR